MSDIHFQDVSDYRKSEVSKHFLYDKAQQRTQCNLCSVTLKAAGSSTKSLIKKTFVWRCVPHTPIAAFCELTAVTIEGKQLDHISRNVREVPFRRAQRVSLSRRYGESNQVVLHVSRGCYH